MVKLHVLMSSSAALVSRKAGPFHRRHHCPHHRRPPPALEDPWYCVGLGQEDDCNFGGCTPDNTLGAYDVPNSKKADCCNTGLHGCSPTHPCGRTINGATVECFGDLNQECANCGIALYNSLSCRTCCPIVGDDTFCSDIFDGDFSFTLMQTLVCDRAFP
jgi:hypothetical protein